MKLSDRIEWLELKGCNPSIHQRGEYLYRAHINSAGNFWADAETPHKAMEAAVKLWREKGQPMDGTARIQSEIKRR